MKIYTLVQLSTRIFYIGGDATIFDIAESKFVAAMIYSRIADPIWGLLCLIQMSLPCLLFFEILYWIKSPRLSVIGSNFAGVMFYKGLPLTQRILAQCTSHDVSITAKIAIISSNSNHFYSSVYLQERPPKFQNPVDFCFCEFSQ